jgi:hypothetical protein
MKSARPIMFPIAHAVALIASLGVASASAQQSFTATVDGKAFESEHDAITVVPTTVGNTVSISARTKGFMTLPRPKGFPDQLAIICPLPKAPQKFSTSSSGGACLVKWTKAPRSMMDADYKTTPHEGEFTSNQAPRDSGFVNFTVVKGKTIEGDFDAQLVDKSTKKTIRVTGKFKGIDEQYGSKGFN